MKVWKNMQNIVDYQENNRKCDMDFLPKLCYNNEMLV